MAEVRVLVLGAGVVGVTTAYALARRGVAVTIVDRESAPAHGASFANGAQLSYAYTDALGSPKMLARTPLLVLGKDPAFRMKLSCDPALISWTLAFLRNCTQAAFDRNTTAILKLALQSQQALSQLLARHSIEFNHVTASKLHLYYTEEALKAAADVVALKRRHGAVQNVLTPRAAVHLEPTLESIADSLAGAVHSPLDEVGDPLRFSSELLTILRSNYGVEALFGFDVASLQTTSGGVVVTDNGGMVLDAEAAVVCLGYEAPRLLKQVGVRVPIWPMKGYSLTAKATSNTPLVSITDTARKIVFCRLGHEVRIAGLAELGEREPQTDRRRLQALAQAAQASLPGSFDPTECRGWSGMRPMTPSSAPIIGPAGAPNVFVNVGHGMLGWTLAMGSAERLADTLVAGRRGTSTGAHSAGKARRVLSGKRAVGSEAPAPR